MSNRIWVPKVLANGRLHPMTVLKAVAGLSRRDNDTKEMTWRSRDINARVGTTSGKNGMDVLADLAEAGVIASYRQRSAGAPYTAVFAAIPHKQRLEVPQVALWEHKWNSENVQGPRYGKDTAQVLRWLLAVLMASDFQPGNLQVVHERGAADICRRSDLSRDGYDRAWAVVRRVCRADPWIKWEETDWDDGGQGPHIITIDWTLLPALFEPPTKAARAKRTRVSLIKKTQVVPAGKGGAVSADGGTAEHGRRGRQVVPEPIDGTSSFGSVLSSPVPSPQLRQQHPSRLRTRQEVDHAQSAAEDLHVQDVIRKGLISQHAGDAQADNRTYLFESWLLAVVASLADANTPNRLGLSRSDVRVLRGLLRPHYEDGWTAGNLASSLTLMEPPRSVSAALRHRVEELPEQPNYVPMGTSRKALDEHRAFEERAGSRTGDKYTQRTL